MVGCSRCLWLLYSFILCLVGSLLLQASVICLVSSYRTLLLDQLILLLKLHFRVPRFGGLPSSLSGSVPAIIAILSTLAKLMASTLGSIYVTTFYAMKSEVISINWILISTKYYLALNKSHNFIDATKITDENDRIKNNSADRCPLYFIRGQIYDYSLSATWLLRALSCWQ